MKMIYGRILYIIQIIDACEKYWQESFMIIHAGTKHISITIAFQNHKFFVKQSPGARAS